MPVGTKASVKWIQREELDEMGAEIILNNTYHLYLRPWDDVVKGFGWVHRFQNYDKPILTDSGGFQVFSLGKADLNKCAKGKKNINKNMINKDTINRVSTERGGQKLVEITDDWVHFRSYIDGSKHFFTPERVMDIQSNLWADIIMAFDECADGKSSHEYARKAMERTHAWAVRSLEQVMRNNKTREKEGLYPQTMFPIVQGVVYDDLRIESAKFISKLDTDWVAIWWLSVWESKEDMYRILDIMAEYLPENKPRYLMWVGTPEDLIEAIGRWIDMFDCVLPTRIWRHWTAFSSFGNVKLKNNKYRLDDSSLDEFCDCKVCRNYSRGYLRHLVTENEIVWMQLLSYHNLYFLIKLTKDSRKAIIENRFEEFRKEFWGKIKTSL